MGDKSCLAVSPIRLLDAAPITRHIPFPRNSPRLSCPQRSRATMDHSYRIRPYNPADLIRLQEITADTFGPVSIDKNMEQLLGSFGRGDWKSRKVLAIAE